MTTGYCDTLLSAWYNWTGSWRTLDTRCLTSSSQRRHGLLTFQSTDRSVASRSARLAIRRRTEAAPVCGRTVWACCVVERRFTDKAGALCCVAVPATTALSKRRAGLPASSSELGVWSPPLLTDRQPTVAVELPAVVVSSVDASN